MIRAIIVLLSIGAFIGSKALQDLGPTCDVGEQEKVSGLCTGNDASKCNDYCKKKYGTELLGAVCSDERKNKKRECICKLKCCNIGCWGDPHCWTCDGVRFGYQGLKKIYLMKPIKKYPTLPEFEINQINKPWKGSPMAMLDISELVVRDWSQIVQVKMPEGENGQYVLTVNEKKENIPYRYSQFDDNRERFINIVYADDKKTQVVLITSFGLRITYTTKPRVGLESDVSIDFPRHPELKDNSNGLLGRWNGNPDDDAIDANGQKQPLDDKFSWPFGDSWIIPGGRTKTAECVREEAKQVADKVVTETDPKLKENVEKQCKQALDSPELKACAKIAGRVVPLIKNCVTDLIFLDNDAERKAYIEDLIDTFATTCKSRGQKFVQKDTPQKGDAVGLAF